MPVTVLGLVYRNPTLTFSQFRTHYETKHIPLIQSLLGANFPSSHLRHYIDKTSGSEGEGSSSPSSFLVGSPAETEPDCITILEFENQDEMAQTMEVTQGPEVAGKLAEDEERFLDRGKTKIIVVGDVMVTRKGE